MKRGDALKVWEDLTRELWPDADVTKAAQRIEHERHVSYLLTEQREWYDDDDVTKCVGCGAYREDIPVLHRADCDWWLAVQALDDARGHEECGRAFDEGMRQAEELRNPGPLAQWAAG